MDTKGAVLPAMPLRIREITLWRREITTHSSAMAEALRPLTTEGLDVGVLLRYRHPIDKSRAFIEVYPQPKHSSYSADHLAAALHTAGFTPRNTPALLIESAHVSECHTSLARMIASLNVNITFLATQITNSTYGAVIGFATAADAEQAAIALLSMTNDSPAVAEHTEHTPSIQ